MIARIEATFDGKGTGEVHYEGCSRQRRAKLALCGERVLNPREVLDRKAVTCKTCNEIVEYVSGAELC